MIDILGQAKQRADQVYHCHSFLTKQDMCTTCISWIHPTLEHGSTLYSGAANTYLCRLDLQSQIERSCLFVFQPHSYC